MVKEEAANICLQSINQMSFPPLFSKCKNCRVCLSKETSTGKAYTGMLGKHPFVMVVLSFFR